MSDQDEQQKPESTDEAKPDEQPKDDEQQEQPADEQPEDKDGEAGEDEAPEEESEGDAKDEDEDSEELDLPRAKEKIAKANAEAKNLRARLRETEEKLANAKTPEEVDEIVKQLQAEREAAEVALLRENVALKFKLPEPLQKRLSGSTREELEADAKELAELFGTSEDDEDLVLEGGLTPRGRHDGPSDPRTLAAKYGARRRRR